MRTYKEHYEAAKANYDIESSSKYNDVYDLRLDENIFEKSDKYLDLVKKGKVMNIRAPKLAIEYYNLKKDAKLSDLIISVRADEMHHADVNHSYADNLNRSISKKSKNKKAA